MTRKPQTGRAPRSARTTQTVAEARAEVEARRIANRDARLAAMSTHFGGRIPGRQLIGASVIVTVVFVVIDLVGAVAGGRAADLAGTAALIIAGVGTVGFMVALWDGAQRSREAEMGIGSWFFLAGSAPRNVQFALLGSLAVQVIVGIAGAWATFDIDAPTPTPLAFGTLVPIFGLAVCGIWGARHGYFAPRREVSGGEGHTPDGEQR